LPNNRCEAGSDANASEPSRPRKPEGRAVFRLRKTARLTERASSHLRVRSSGFERRGRPGPPKAITAPVERVKRPGRAVWPYLGTRRTLILETLY
jgi:hypothetical protein